jgi:meiotically up-regulated gene 157 (Mug157) protein
LTNFARNNGIKSWLKHLVAHGLKGQLISATQGADSVVYLATSDEVRGRTGNYYYQRREIESSPASHDHEAAKRLWLLSLKLTGVTTPHFRAASF